MKLPENFEILTELTAGILELEKLADSNWTPESASCTFSFMNAFFMRLLFISFGIIRSGLFKTIQIAKFLKAKKKANEQTQDVAEMSYYNIL